jgi:cell division protein FtsW (lipid II flippase)
MYIVLLYFLLAYHTMIAISSMRDPQYKLISIGIISLIIVQAFVNIGVNSNIIPNTWLTLPFMSYWWTALMINLIEITLLYKFIENKR